MLSKVEIPAWSCKTVKKVIKRPREWEYWYRYMFYRHVCQIIIFHEDPKGNTIYSGTMDHSGERV